MYLSCKGYSRSFSDVLLVCVVSAASLQIMVDHGRKQQENERFSVGVYTPHRLNRGLELNVCVVQSIKLFHCLTSSTTAQKQAFSFPLFLAKKQNSYILISVTELHYVLSLNEPVFGVVTLSLLRCTFHVFYETTLTLFCMMAKLLQMLFY